MMSYWSKFAKPSFLREIILGFVDNLSFSIFLDNTILDQIPQNQTDWKLKQHFYAFNLRLGKR